MRFSFYTRLLRCVHDERLVFNLLFWQLFQVSFSFKRWQINVYRTQNLLFASLPLCGIRIHFRFGSSSWLRVFDVLKGLVFYMSASLSTFYSLFFSITHHILVRFNLISYIRPYFLYKINTFSFHTKLFSSYTLILLFLLHQKEALKYIRFDWIVISLLHNWFWYIFLLLRMLTWVISF